MRFGLHAGNRGHTSHVLSIRTLHPLRFSSLTHERLSNSKNDRCGELVNNKGEKRLRGTYRFALKVPHGLREGKMKRKVLIVVAWP